MFLLLTKINKNNQFIILHNNTYYIILHNNTFRFSFHQKSHIKLDVQVKKKYNEKMLNILENVFSIDTSIYLYIIYYVF